MKIFFILYISLFLTVFPVYADEIPSVVLIQSGDVKPGYPLLEGEIAAEDYYTGNSWFAGGIASGFILGLIGAGIFVGVSQIGTVNPPARLLLTLQEKPDTYISDYLLSYSKKAKKIRIKKSLQGGLIGTVAVVILILSLDDKNK